MGFLYLEIRVVIYITIQGMVYQSIEAQETNNRNESQHILRMCDQIIKGENIHRRITKYHGDPLAALEF